jgi:hypothetical protein
MGHIGTALYKKVAVWPAPVKGQMTPVDFFDVFVACKLIRSALMSADEAARQGPSHLKRKKFKVG